jgi:hypothetical protein
MRTGRLKLAMVATAAVLLPAEARAQDRPGPPSQPPPTAAPASPASGAVASKSSAIPDGAARLVFFFSRRSEPLVAVWRTAELRVEIDGKVVGTRKASWERELPAAEAQLALGESLVTAGSHTMRLVDVRVGSGDVLFSRYRFTVRPTHEFTVVAGQTLVIDVVARGTGYDFIHRAAQGPSFRPGPVDRPVPLAPQLPPDLALVGPLGPTPTGTARLRCCR